MASEQDLDDALAEQRVQIEWARRLGEEGLNINRAILATQERMATSLERIAATLEERKA